MPTTLPEPIADQIIADKIKEWEQKKQELKVGKGIKEIKPHPFLTIARDFGCREEEIIPGLEKSLGWKVYGRNMLDHLARREQLSRSFIETLDEHRQNLIENWINFLIHSGSIMQHDYVVKISRLIKVIVAQENAIFLGRGINYILEDKKGEDPTRPIQKRDLMKLVTKGLNRNERLIIILYYYEELTMKEIGITLDLSESRVSQMHSSIVNRLQSQLGRRRPEFGT